MSKIGLVGGGYTLIPEGEVVLKITSVDDEKLEDFGKIEVVLCDAKGRKHTERFNFTAKDGSQNETAMWYFSTLARAALDLAEDDMREIDPQDLVGKYIRTDIYHEEVENKKKPGEYNKFSRMAKEKYHADGFEGAAPAEPPAKDTTAKFNLDDLLG